MKTELIRRLKQLDVVCREPVVLKHAGASDFYIDIKKAYGYPGILDLICDNVWPQTDRRTTCIAAEGYGGVPLASVLAARHNLKLAIVRTQTKKHGKGGFIDGHVPTKEDRVSIYDDVFTTGESLRYIIEVIRPTEAEILGCYVVVKRGEGHIDVPLSYLLMPEDLF